MAVYLLVLLIRIKSMKDNPLGGDIEILKNGDFQISVNWFHSEFSNDIESAVKTGQGLMYFWAVAGSYFKAWMFKQNGLTVKCSNLVKQARAMIAVIWGTQTGHFLIVA